MKKEFGKINDRTAYLYTIENDNIRLSVSDYGATLVSVVVKEVDTDVVSGFDDVNGYKNDVQYMGQTIGRVCNRIYKGTFKLNGKEYHVPCNNKGNSLHGGTIGFDQKFFDVEVLNDRIICSLTSPDGDMGYPGNLKLKVVYRLLEDGFAFDYSGISDQDTLLNITNHSYFNLDGINSTSVLDHQVKINSNFFGLVDKDCCSFDDFRAVPLYDAFDFRRFKKLGKHIELNDEQLKFAHGYDHHYLVNGMGMRPFVICRGKNLQMFICSDLPGFHLYTANFLGGNHHGKGGNTYPSRSSVCFETEYYPNAINTISQVKPIAKKDQLVEHSTEYHFSLYFKGVDYEAK